MSAKKQSQTNAQKFIEAYNQIDYSLRVQHDFKRSMGFSDMIRRAVAVNFIVRKYEDDLIDYGRLRNAIIHRSNENFIIAEPHDDVVEKICGLAKLISTPPKAIDSITDKGVLTVDYNVAVRDVIELIAKSSYSNLPVYQEGTLVGVANGQKILDKMGLFLVGGGDIKDFLEHKTIIDILGDTAENNYYEVMPVTTTIEEAMDKFYARRKLLCLIITKTGSMHEPPIGILTTHDYMEMNKIMDNY